MGGGPPTSRVDARRGSGFTSVVCDEGDLDPVVEVELLEQMRDVSFVYVIAWIPLMIFAFLYGLSMDYEVFMLSRIRRPTTRPARPRKQSSSALRAQGSWSRAAG
jgi:hypothetical protein